MKIKLTIVSFCIVLLSYSQSYIGKGDEKMQIGISFVDGGTGLLASYDRGLGENISVGISSTYLLSANSYSYTDSSVNYTVDPDAIDRFDLKARVNVHLTDVLNISDNFDFYPGLNIGLKNLGLHTGARYFFTKGFGLFSEIDFPIAKFDDKADFQYFNGFKLNLGVSLNLE